MNDELIKEVMDEVMKGINISKNSDSSAVEGTDGSTTNQRDMNEELFEQVMDEVVKKIGASEDSDSSADKDSDGSTVEQEGMNDEFIKGVMDEVMKGISTSENSDSSAKAAADDSIMKKESNPHNSECNLTEFVGMAAGHTIGLVIANIDSQIQEKLEIPVEFKAVGIVGARCGAAPQIFAADEAVKASNSKIVRIELARDDEGGAGHGCLIIFGAEDVSDVKRAIEVCLEQLKMTFGEVYKNSAGHLEFQYTARASYALNKVYGAEIGKSFGMTIGAPAAIGILMADVAAKSAPLDIVKIGTPGNGETSFSNEVMVGFSGDSGAVKQAVMSAREIGMQLLKAMAPSETLKSESEPYI